jgi:hypothetical protein
MTSSIEYLFSCENYAQIVQHPQGLRPRVAHIRRGFEDPGAPIDDRR